MDTRSAETGEIWAPEEIGDAGSEDERRKARYKRVRVFPRTSHWEEIAQSIRNRSRARNMPIRLLDWQIHAASSFLQGKDQVIVNATGSGKSFCFQAPLIHATGKIVLVISPLITLMQTQVIKCEQLGIKAAALTADNIKARPELIAESVNGQYEMVFASPEVLDISNEIFERMTKSKAFRDRLIGIVIDEAHLVHSWRSFRPKYAQLANIHIHFPKLPIMALSATLTPYVRNFIHANLRLADPTDLIKMSVDRANLYLHVQAIEGNAATFDDIQFVVKRPGREGAVRTPGEIPKTLIFCDDRGDGCTMTTLLRLRIAEIIERHENAVLEYSTALSMEKRNHNLELFISGECRILVCTEAFAMGVDIPDIDRVVQWRLPTHLGLIGLVQRFGRAKRTGDETGVCILLHTKSCLIGPRHRQQYDILKTPAHHPHAQQALKMIESFDKGEEQKKKQTRAPGVRRAPKRRRTLAEELLGSGAEPEGSHQAPQAPRERDPPMMCRGLLWFINTSGDRREVLLRCLDDDDWNLARETTTCCDKCTPRTGLSAQIQNMLPPSAPRDIAASLSHDTTPAVSNTPFGPPNLEVAFDPKVCKELTGEILKLRQATWASMGMTKRHCPYVSELLLTDKEINVIVKRCEKITQFTPDTLLVNDKQKKAQSRLPPGLLKAIYEKGEDVYTRERARVIAESEAKIVRMAQARERAETAARKKAETLQKKALALEKKAEAAALRVVKQQAQVASRAARLAKAQESASKRSRGTKRTIPPPPPPLGAENIPPMLMPLPHYPLAPGHVNTMARTPEPPRVHAAL